MSDRLIVAVRAARVDAANRAAAIVDPPPAGATFDQPLKTTGDETNTIVAYWCGWQLTPGTKAALVQAFRDEGFTNPELLKVPAQSTPNAAHDIFVFDADDWTSKQAALALGVRRVPVIY